MARAVSGRVPTTSILLNISISAQDMAVAATQSLTLASLDGILAEEGMGELAEFRSG
jgi:hypothetical protein